LEEIIKRKGVTYIIKMTVGQHAIVRDVPNTYTSCVKVNPPQVNINVGLAKEQHNYYCEILERLGITLIRIEADDKFPDCCFVEDTAMLFGDVAIISHMGTISRIGEEIEIKKILHTYMEKTYNIKTPATVDGGDVLKINKNVFIGLSNRTNQSAIQQIGSFISEKGYQVIPIKTEKILHLKSCCTYLGNDYVVMVPGYFDDKVFSEYKKILIPKIESYGANCLSINGRVLISEKHPATKKLIESEGFETIDVPMSEFRKGEGSLTCLSIIF